MFLNYKSSNYQGKLSARAYNSAFTQATSIIRGTVEHRKRLLFILNKLILENNNPKKIEYIKEKLEENKISKPNINNISAELSSNCIDFYFDSKHFNLFIKLKCTGFPVIKLPVKFTKPFNKRKDWKLLKGISINESYITLRQSTEKPKLKEEGKIVGADMGIKTCLSLSDEQVTKKDIHNHDLDSIIQKLSRKQKGSKGFRKAQEHRKNYINWSINQLNFSDIKQVNLEKNNFKGSKKSRFLSHFSHHLTERKLVYKSEELGVQVLLKPSAYKSQRCCGCCIVQKGNRKGKEFICKSCGLRIDADINSAKNNEIDLPIIPKWVYANKLNKEGFYWKASGLYDLLGQELRVPDALKE